MKISLKLANGATLEFDGDAAEFERVQAFLAEPPEAFTANQEARPSRRPDPVPSTGSNDDRVEDEPIADLDARGVAEALETVGANNDVERVTVMTFLAGEVAAQGIDYATVDRLYTELGLKKPNRFAKTFFNAKASGLVRSVGHGRWRVTVKGENFARGHGRATAARARAGRSTAPRPQLALTDEGGEEG